jgi:UDP-N-acetylglucosamine--N-acetylmuramyl-(pentapeptide) pyrophosphoryl-undecaprenol N-acetylglucosamine transferase
MVKTILDAPKGRYAVTGGGTGGHVYPALAICRQLNRRGYRSIYIGHPRRLEAIAAPNQGIPFYGVVSDCFYGLRLSRLFFSWPCISSILQCISILRREKAKFLVAVGGYVSVPAFLAATILRLPTIVHEQNAKPGRANRLFLRFKPLFLTTFSSTSRYAGKGVHTLHTGCPIDESIGTIPKDEAKRSLEVEPTQCTVLVVGGSGGAAMINEICLGLIPLLESHQEVVLFHVTGKSYYEAVRPEWERLCPDYLRRRYRLLPYASPIAQYYAAADAIISRSGAATINEIMSLGVPCILIPSPNVAENHQEVNARVLEAAGLAEVILERDLTTSKIISKLESILRNPHRYSLPAADLGELKDPRQAADAIAQAIEDYISVAR